MYILLMCLVMTLYSQGVTQDSQDISQPIEGIKLSTEVFDRFMEELRKPRYTEVIMEVSAYTYHEGGNIGAWGDTLKLGDCASDDLPYETKVIMDGKEYTVRDRFGGGYKDRLDIYYGSDLDGALEFGRRTMKVKVKEE